MKEIFPFYSIGHFINEPENPTEFEITQFEEMEEPNVDDVHKHSFYEILWVDEGRSRQTIDYQTYELQNKSLFFISPGQVHEFEAWQGLKGGTIMFTGDFFLQNQANRDRLFELSFLDNIYFNPNFLLPCAEYAIFRNFINLLIEEKKRADANKEILQSLLHILLLQVHRSIQASQNRQIPKRNVILFKEFKNLLEKHYPEGLAANQYAGKLNITQHHLNRIIKDITGKTATEVIRARSILEAKRLLSFTDQTISEISSNLNYFDSSYFSKVFKAETGRSPLEFRSSMSEKYRKIQLSL
jgi:AraC-like DNA-binding protein